MAKTDLNIPTLAGRFTDLRDSIPGDSFNWSWVRPLSQVNYLAIHHTAAPNTQTPNEIANFHINSNGWGGIGYHFLIGKDGMIYYVGDIATARANVANLNEQVIGICLIGNFTSVEPTNEQLDSANKLCDFFINSYPDLTNVNSWDVVRGHKELPGQSTACPGNTWDSWKGKIISGDISVTPVTPIPVTPSPTPPVTSPSLPSIPTDRGAQISELYRSVLGRDPDMGGLQTYTNGPMSIDQIMISMVNSSEHRSLVERSKQVDGLQSQVDSLQTTLASVNQQVISLQEAVQERDQEISDLKTRFATATLNQPGPSAAPEPKVDNTLTIVGALINLYKFIFPSRMETPS